MHSLLQSNKTSTDALCKEYGVARLEAFGSVTSGNFDDTRSDVDFVAHFADKSPGYATRYLRFAEALEKLLGRRVDVITPNSISNPYFRDSVDETREVIYEEGRSEWLMV